VKQHAVKLHTPGATEAETIVATEAETIVATAPQVLGTHELTHFSSLATIALHPYHVSWAPQALTQHTFNPGVDLLLG